MNAAKPIRRSCGSSAGHGLGLSMVRESVALYGGRLFTDASPGLGRRRVEL
jgi:signal transduction histidine kinase